MPADQKTETTSVTNKELGEIRREVIEARNLVIKTDNLLKNLHAELKQVSSRQEEFQKSRLVSSAAAYVLFAVLAVGGALMVSNARTSTATGERERLERTVADLTGQLEKQKGETATQASAERAAAEVYKMMTVPSGEERLKGVDALMRLDTSRLSTLEKEALNDRAQLLRKEIGQSAFERGKAAFRKNDMAGAVGELTRFVAMNPDQPDLVEASFFLGCALNSLKKHDQAIPYLSRYVNEGEHKSNKNREYAMLLLAQSYEQTGQLDKGAQVVRDALGAYPSGEFGTALRYRLTSIKRLQGAGADSPAVQAALQPAAAAPATSPAATVPAAAHPAVPSPKPAPAAAHPAPAAPQPPAGH